MRSIRHALELLSATMSLCHILNLTKFLNLCPNVEGSIPTSDDQYLHVFCQPLFFLHVHPLPVR